MPLSHTVCAWPPLWPQEWTLLPALRMSPHHARAHTGLVQAAFSHPGGSPYVHCRRYAALNPAYIPFTSPLRFTICTAASTTPLYLISPLTCARKRANVSIIGSRDGQDRVCGASKHNKHPICTAKCFERMHFATHLHLHPQCVERMAHGRGSHSAHRCHHHFLSKRVGRLGCGRRR